MNFFCIFGKIFFLLTKNQIIATLFTGKNFCDCIKKIQPEHLREDLKQEVILVICELSEEKIQGLHLRKQLEFYTVRIILNMVKNSNHPFSKKFRTIHCELTNNEISENIVDEERQLREDIEDMAIEEIDRLYWYDKGLIELYMKHGNFRAIEKVTGIPYVSCYHNIKKSLKHIKCKVTR